MTHPTRALRKSGAAVPVQRGQAKCWAVLKVAAIALSLAAMCIPAHAASQTKASKPVKGGPRANWTGVWVIVDSFLDRQDGSSVSAPTGREEDAAINILKIGTPKLKPEPAKRSKVYTDSLAAGRPLAGPQCMPRGMPEFWYGPYAWEIIQSADQINLFQEIGGLRRVYLDGRKHPSLDDVDPLFEGHSIGHWEGDVLVVDTINFRTDTFISGPGTNHTEKSRIVERFRPIADDRIDVEVTVSNPDVIEEPWTFTRRLKRKPGMEILDYYCEENDRNPVGDDGRQKATLPSQK